MIVEQIGEILAEHWLTILAILGLIGVSGIFSGSETALTAASRARMHSLETSGETRAGTVNSLIERKDRLIGALLIGNNLVNILASALWRPACCCRFLAIPAWRWRR
jgi:Mg2+/Co2+ transporter CorB